MMFVIRRVCVLDAGLRLMCFCRAV